MNARLSQHMTILGLCVMVFYCIMLGTGNVSIDLMPQFLISAVIFLSSGKIMRKAALKMARDEDDEEPAKTRQPEPDWAWLTGLLNWSAAFLIIGVMAIILMKPIGVTFQEALSQTLAHQHFFATAVP